MNKDEIIRYVEMGSRKSVCISRCLFDLYPGYVRDITIMQNHKVRIEFNAYGYDEGGLTINIYYEDYDKLIDFLEEYIGIKISNWENISKTGYYPELEEKIDINVTGMKLKTDFIDNKIPLPKGGIKYEVPIGYWKDLLDGNV